MEKFKRNERLAVMTSILSGAPNRIFTLSALQKQTLMQVKILLQKMLF